MTRETSIEAYYNIRENGLLSAMRFAVYEVLVLNGPKTAQQVTVTHRLRGAWKRLSELREQGVVREVGEVVCPITGEAAILWEAVDGLPRPLPRAEVRETPKERIRSLEAEVETYRELLKEGVRFAKQRASDLEVDPVAESQWLSDSRALILGFPDED